MALSLMEEGTWFDGSNVVRTPLPPTPLIATREVVKPAKHWRKKQVVWHDDHPSTYPNSHTPIRTNEIEERDR